MTSNPGDSPVFSTLAPMFVHFAVLSLMAIGGGVVMVAPDMQRFVVDSHHWITAEQFSAAYALAQAAPGPNFLYITLVGWEVAGWAGAVAATVAVLVPPAVLSVAMVHASGNRAPGRLARSISKGLVPISVGLVFATGWILLRGSGSWHWRGATLALIAATIVFRTRINPVWVIAGGALVGVAGFI